MSAQPDTAGGAARSPRWLALDAVRAALVLLVLLFHVGLSYAPPNLLWSAHDRTSQAVGLGVFTSNLFIMVTFFLVSGFAGRALLERRGESAFIRDRWLRIVLPLLVLLVPLDLLIYLAWSYGDRAMAGIDPAHVPTAIYGLARYPLGHLWFLYVIAIFYAAALFVRRLARPLAEPSDRIVRFAVRSWLGPMVFCVPVTLSMIVSTGWDPWTAIPIPTLLPNVHALAGYGAAFLVGWLLHRQQDLLPQIARQWPLWLPLALAMTAALLAVILTDGREVAAMPLSRRAMLAAMVGLASWSWVWAILGVALRFLAQPPRGLLYLAGASYWIYLAHLPLAMALPVALMPLALPSIAKFALASALCVAILLASYEWLVKTTFVGHWLNGKAQPRTKNSAGLSTGGAD